MHPKSCRYPLSLCALALVACDVTKESDDDTTDATFEGTDTTATAPTFDELELTLAADIPTVVTVAWTTDQPTIGQVVLTIPGEDRVVESALDDEPSLDHSFTLVGLPEATDAQAVALAHTDDGQIASPSLPFSTGSLSPSIPRPGVWSDAAAGSQPRGFTLAPMGTEQASWVSILDGHGRLVWAYGGNDFRTHRARPTLDGQGVILAETQPEEPGMDLTRMDWDGTEQWRISLPDGHHDFAVIDDETMLVLSAVAHEVETSWGTKTFLSDALLEVSPDGSQRTVWDAWDYFEVDVDQLPNRSVEYDDAYDWSHANYLHYDPVADTVMITLRDLDAAVELDRPSGQVLWSLGGGEHGLVDTSADGLLDFPHSISRTSDGVVVFNQHDYIEGGCAEASFIRIDWDEGQAGLDWQYDSDDCQGVYYLGNAQMLTPDRLLVSFATSGVLEEVDMGTQAAIWRLTLPAGTQFRYAEHLPSIGPAAP